LSNFIQNQNSFKIWLKDEKAAYLPRFFQASEGGYGEGDRFIGVAVPHQRKVAKNHYKAIDIKDVERLLNEPIHEYRLTALFMLVHKFERTKDEQDRECIVDTYINNIEAVNNWDLVDVQPEGGFIHITVEDTGLGVPPKAISKLGTRFYRPSASRDRHTGGSGLGLSIAREIIELHDGYLSFDCISGKGLSVKMSLPQAPPEL
jgi:signal transduction histidine kinase